MIFTGFKRKSNQIFFKKTLPGILKNELKRPFNEVKKVLIFLDATADRASIVSELTSILKISESDIKVVVFLRKLKNENMSNDIITPKDFGWYGKIDSEKIKNILTNKYDLLINYSKVDNVYLNILLLQSKATFKVGFAHLDKRLYDLMIRCETDEIALFNEELLKYLVILKIVQ
ncbi:MAG: hypothetical protein A3F91_03370 [Flavobacteria bacterium RIFCSPLOWO2_12_FULL_35_11]|nr:MAG: hypothetical protein A3F91_03370 [Flavobacteria bacterium RIFCSPLOWO2_12_FULL_35_11]